MDIESDILNNEEASLHMIQELLLDKDRSFFKSEILKLQKKVFELIKKSEDKSSQSMLVLSSSHEDQLNVINKQLTELVNSKFSNNEAEISKLSQSTKNDLLALKKDLTAQTNKCKDDLTKTISKNLDNSSSQILNEAKKLHTLILNIEKINLESINAQSQHMKDSFKNIVASQEEQSSLQTNLTNDYENKFLDLNKTLDKINNKIDLQIRESQKNFNEIINSVVKNHEETLNKKLFKFDVDFKEYVNLNTNNINAQIKVLIAEQLKESKDREHELLTNVTSKIEAQHKELIKFTQGEVRDAVVESQKFSENKLKNYDQDVKKQYLKLSSELTSKIDNISNVEFHQSKVAQVFSDVLASKIRDNPSEISALLAPIISEVISKTDKDDFNSIVSLFAEHIPTKLKQIQKNNMDKKNIFDEIISVSLPKAVEMQGSKPNSEFSKNLTPMIGFGLQNQIKNDKDKIVDALYPVIGSTISKYMAESMKELLDKVNQKIDDTLSIKKYLQGFKNKFIKHSDASNDALVASVQSVYLIHKLTGIVLLDKHDTALEKDNKQMVGGMFTAITSFVNDWIKKDGKNKVIDSIEYGDSKVVFETSGSLILALVVSMGEIQPIKKKARILLETIHGTYSEDISNFNGDVDSLPNEFDKSLSVFFSTNAAKQH